MAYAFVSATANATASLAGFVVSAGQHLIIIAGDETAASSTLTMSDGTNTYLSRGTVNDTSFNATRTLLDCMNPTPGTYTLTLAGAATGDFIVCLYTGLLGGFAAGSFKSFFALAPSTAVDACATTSITPTSYAAALICGSLVVNGGPSSAVMAAGTGFTDRFNNNIAMATSNGGFVEDLRQTSGSHIASYTCTANNTGSGVALIAGAYLETADVLNAQISL